MISELNHNEFYKCKTLINDEGHLEVKAIIEGNNRGRIFVDHTDSPTTGLIWLGNHDGFFFIGDEGNEEFNHDLNEFIDDVIFPEAKELGLKHFIAIGNHSGWDQTIERIFEQRPMNVSHQSVYKLRKSQVKETNVPPIEKDYNVFQICRELFENKSLTIENIDFLHSKLLEFWSSPEDFFQKGIGYCVVHRKRIVSLCFSGFVAENTHALDIETIETYQGNKLAQRAARSVVKDCLDKGMKPYWDCEEANTPSNAIARKIGLENEFKYLVYIFPIE
ncbi:MULTISPECIES: GNAT family N-acetyltransferase [Pontibacillus]|uniref:GNAT family N-acetyltransferase n=1 Tax=Pontibacillus chungwhensis TaxID=265426 RepID=A0ABY8UWG3_9BACI|nr:MULTISPECIES: GNAT family N-acetyltransferase [Pontibacillus]MCD5323379.1 GNAT family N-acetyltransferase [Pontibacillus sp. HN14]WIF96760.1 GNAT family N-acetyltransferase [Pontibacillus chungwhensis]